MTDQLRDQFAGQALIGLLFDSRETGIEPFNANKPAHVKALVESAYRIADAMLSVRSVNALPALVEALERLERTASEINARQHAGFDIEPALWSDLFQECQAARSALASARKDDGA